MSESFDYPRLLQRALRTVVREVLTVTATEGLPGGHHFYLSLRTDRDDVRMPPFVRQRYPEEMTVVLQNQFWDLSVADHHFAVTLRFDGMPARLEVPFDAVVAFFDPAAQFGLRFDLAGLGGTAPVVPPDGTSPALETAAPAAVLPHKATFGPAPAPEADGAEPAASSGEPTADDEGPHPAEGKVLSFDRVRDRREPEE